MTATAVETRMLDSEDYDACMEVVAWLRHCGFDPSVVDEPEDAMIAIVVKISSMDQWIFHLHAGDTIHLLDNGRLLVIGARQGLPFSQEVRPVRVGVAEGVEDGSPE